MDLNSIIYKTVGKPIDQFLSKKKAGNMLNTGDKAPDFTAQTSEGKTVSLSDYRGKNLVLWFYPKADTPGCTAEGCAFRDRLAKFREKNTAVLGVSFDSVEENQKFARKFGFQFPLLCDTTKSVGMNYGACKTTEDRVPARIGYVIDPEGMIKHAFPKVDAANFPEQVLAML